MVDEGIDQFLRRTFLNLNSKQGLLLDDVNYQLGKDTGCRKRAQPQKTARALTN